MDRRSSTGLILCQSNHSWKVMWSVRTQTTSAVHMIRTSLRFKSVQWRVPTPFRNKNWSDVSLRDTLPAPPLPRKTLKASPRSCASCSTRTSSQSYKWQKSTSGLAGRSRYRQTGQRPLSKSLLALWKARTRKRSVWTGPFTARTSTSSAKKR